MNRPYEAASVPVGNPLEPAVATAELRLLCGCYGTCDHGVYCRCAGCQLAPETCKHGETEAHHFTADDYPVPGLWRCPGPKGDDDDDA